MNQKEFIKSRLNGYSRKSKSEVTAKDKELADKIFSKVKPILDKHGFKDYEVIIKKFTEDNGIHIKCINNILDPISSRMDLGNDLESTGIELDWYEGDKPNEWDFVYVVDRWIP